MEEEIEKMKEEIRSEKEKIRKDKEEFSKEKEEIMKMTKINDFSYLGNHIISSIISYISYFVVFIKIL